MSSVSQLKLVSSSVLTHLSLAPQLSFIPVSAEIGQMTDQVTTAVDFVNAFA